MKYLISPESRIIEFNSKQKNLEKMLKNIYCDELNILGWCFYRGIYNLARNRNLTYILFKFDYPIDIYIKEQLAG